MTPTRRSSVLLSLAAAAAVTAAAIAAPQTPASEHPPEDFSALAVTMGNVGPAQPTLVDISIRRWPDEEERTRIVTALTENGSDGLLKALRDTPRVGTIRTIGTVGYELRYAHQTQMPGGVRRIVILTDRPIGFGEARESSRTLDYPFTLVELRIKPDGKGEGTLSLATKVVPVGRNTIYFEDFGTQPIQLTNVQARKQSQ